MRMNTQAAKAAYDAMNAPLPAGWYKARVVAVQDVDAASGAQMTKVRFFVKTGASQRTLTVNLTYRNGDGENNDIGMGHIYAMALVTNAFDADGNIVESMMVGNAADPKAFGLKLAVQEQNNGYRDQNQVVEFKPVDEL